MVCEAVSGFICNMEIHSAEEEVGGHNIITLDRNLGQNHHIYQDSFYNTMRYAQTLPDRNVRVCGIPRVLVGEGKRLKKGQSASILEERGCSTSVEEQKTCANDKYDP